LAIEALRRLGWRRRGEIAPATLVAGEVLATPPAPEIDAQPAGNFRTFESLSDSSFRWFFVSMLCWFGSMNMQQLARGVIVYDMTGSYAALGTVALANAVPGLFFSLPGGLVADRLNCKQVVQAGQLSNTLISLIIAALMLTGLITFEYLVVSAIFQGAINSLMMPARQSMVPELVSGERLMNAVALNSAGTNIMRLAGPPVGGMLLVVMGAGWVYMAMAALYAAGAVCMLPVRSRPGALAERETLRLSRRGTSPGSLGGMLRDLAEGCRYMMRDRVIFLVLAVSFVIVLLSQPYQMLLPGFAKDVLGASPGELGLLMSLTGVGALAGSLVVASMRARRRGLVLLCSAFVMGVTTLAFALSTNIWFTALIVLAIGVGQSFRMSISSVLIQTYTEPEYRGRVMSVYMMEFSLVAFGTFFVGLLSNAIGVQAALGATAATLAVLSVLAIIFLPRMRRLD
jgi:MFS family permease